LERTNTLIFFENPTNNLVADTRSQTAGQAETQALLPHKALFISAENSQQKSVPFFLTILHPFHLNNYCPPLIRTDVTLTALMGSFTFELILLRKHIKSCQKFWPSQIQYQLRCPSSHHIGGAHPHSCTYATLTPRMACGQGKAEVIGWRVGCDKPSPKGTRHATHPTPASTLHTINRTANQIMNNRRLCGLRTSLTKLLASRT